METCSRECPGGECVVGENGNETCVCLVGQFFNGSACVCEYNRILICHVLNVCMIVLILCCKVCVQRIVYDT